MPNYKKMKMADKAEVETREEYNQRRYQETQRSNLNKMEKISPNPLYQNDRDEAKKAAREAQQGARQKMLEEIKKRRKDPFANG